MHKYTRCFVIDLISMCYKIMRILAIFILTEELVKNIAFWRALFVTFY